MTPIRVRSGHPNHELNDLSCFDRWFTARANKPTISRGGLRSKAKALSNLIHLFRASGCPSLPIDDSASPRATRWDTSTWGSSLIDGFFGIYLNRLLKEVEVRATILLYI